MVKNATGGRCFELHFVCVLCQQLTERVCHKLCELHSVAHAPFVVCVFHLFYSYVFPCLYTCLYAFRSPILGGRPREPTRAHGSPREPTRANGSSRKQPGATKSSLNPRASAVLSWWGPLGGTPAPPQPIHVWRLLFRLHSVAHTFFVISIVYFLCGIAQANFLLTVARILLLLHFPRFPFHASTGFHAYGFSSVIQVRSEVSFSRNLIARTF